jgi:hypothetical protein
MESGFMDSRGRRSMKKLAEFVAVSVWILAVVALIALILRASAGAVSFAFDCLTIQP